MRDFYFFTSKPIFAKNCYESLNKEIKNVVLNGETNIRINGKHRSYLWFNNERLTDFVFSSEDEFEELKNQIPIQDPYVNDFETHRSVDAKRVIRVLMAIFPELYVEVSDDDWYGTAQEYLDTEFDY